CRAPTLIGGPASPVFLLHRPAHPGALRASPTRRSSDLLDAELEEARALADDRQHAEELEAELEALVGRSHLRPGRRVEGASGPRSEEHTSELQSRENLVCRLLLEKKKKRGENGGLGT